MPAFLWVEMDLFPLMGRAAAGGVFWGVCGLSMILGACLLIGGFMFLFCLLFVMGRSALEPAGSWVEPGLGVEMDTSRRVFTQLIFPGARNSLVF